MKWHAAYLNMSSTPTVRVRLILMMGLEYFIWGAWLPLIWPYMAALGFSGTQIAWVGSTFALASIVAIFFGNDFVDRRFSAQNFLAVSHAVGGGALLGLYFTHAFAPFFALMLLYSIFYVPTLSVVNAVTFAHVTDAAREFGWIRVGGTVGWIAAAWPLYFILNRGFATIFLVAGIASFAQALLCLRLPPTPPSASARTGAWREAWRLLCSRPFLLVLFAATFIDATVHNGYFLLTGGFLAQIGVPARWIMPVMSIGQVAEIAAMALLGLVLRRLGWKRTLLLGAGGQVARFLVFSYCAGSLPAIIATQVLHGACYAFFFATVYILVDAAFPAHVRASAQGLFNLLILGLGDLAAKWIFLPLQARLTDAHGTDYRTLFLFPAALAVISFILIAAGFRTPAAQLPAPSMLAARTDA